MATALDDEVEGILAISVTWNATQDLGWIVWKTLALHVVALGLKSKPSYLALYAHSNTFWSM